MFVADGTNIGWVEFQYTGPECRKTKTKFSLLFKPSPRDWRKTKQQNVVLRIFHAPWHIFCVWKNARTTFWCIVVSQFPGRPFKNVMDSGSQSETYILEMPKTAPMKGPSCCHLADHEWTRVTRGVTAGCVEMRHPSHVPTLPEVEHHLLHTNLQRGQHGQHPPPIGLKSAQADCSFWVIPCEKSEKKMTGFFLDFWLEKSKVLVILGIKLLFWLFFCDFWPFYWFF